MTSVAAPTVPKPPGPSLRLAIAAVILGAVIAIPTFIAGFAPIVRTFTASSRFEAPDTVRVDLGEGTYLVYQQARSGSPFSRDERVTITPTDVTVSGPDGARVDVSDRDEFPEAMSDGGDRYVEAVRFSVPVKGEYTISIDNVAPTSVLIARPLTDTIASAVVWFVLSGIGVVILIIGVILWIVGSVRRGRRSAFAYSAPVPPGWHPDPAGSGRWRYWDGYRWTEHLQ